MRTHKLLHDTTRVVLAMLAILATATRAQAVEMRMIGEITGVVNGTPVDFDVDILMDFDTGEETAVISNIPPELGPSLRPVTAMVTIAGPTGGMTTGKAQTLFELSGGNFTNEAIVFWPDLTDSIEIIHDVSYPGFGDTLTFVATMNGTAPIIDLADPVQIFDFAEVLVRGTPSSNDESTAAETIVTGPGQRPYDVGGTPFPPCPPTCPGGGGNGKYSVTTYPTGPPLPFPTLRRATDISTTYDPATQEMSVHLFNFLSDATVDVDAAPDVPDIDGVARAVPSPFVYSTRLELTLDESANVDVSVYDMSGRLVRHLHSGGLVAGSHTFEWDGTNEEGRDSAPGMYFIRADGGSSAPTTRVVRIR